MKPDIQELHPLIRLRRACDAALSLIFPDQVRCLACSEVLGEGTGLCASCRSALAELEARQIDRERGNTEPLPEGIAYVHAAYPYEGAARQLILRMKFGHVRAAAIPLAQAMAALPTAEEELIVPVPTTKKRLRRRGFNQAALLGAQLSAIWGMPYEEALTRADEREPQSTLSEEARRKNLIGCMRASASVSGMRVLLVDDVYTTGATAAEAARALQAAGARSVGVLTAAQSVYEREEKTPLFAPRKR